MLHCRVTLHKNNQIIMHLLTLRSLAIDNIHRGKEKLSTIHIMQMLTLFDDNWILIKQIVRINLDNIDSDLTDQIV